MVSTPAPVSHFYPYATSPDIIRSHEKDVAVSASLGAHLTTIARALRGARFAHTHSAGIARVAELLYLGLTTVLGNRTLGEEYCDLVQLEEGGRGSSGKGAASGSRDDCDDGDHHHRHGHGGGHNISSPRLPSPGRRIGYVLCTVLLPWLLARSLLPALRTRLRAALERSAARVRGRLARARAETDAERQKQRESEKGRGHHATVLGVDRTGRRGSKASKLSAASAGTSSSSTALSQAQTRTTRLTYLLRVHTYALSHLDSLTSTSPLHAANRAAFYFAGAYYHLSKRLLRLRYVFSKRIDPDDRREGYEVLGLLMVVQGVVQGIMHVRETLHEWREEDRNGAKEEDVEADTEAEIQVRPKKGAAAAVVLLPPHTPALPDGVPRYNLERDADADLCANLDVPWIPPQARRCTLCLDALKDPAATTCGHVFCWVCIRDWVREKAACPLCRQEAIGSKVLPLRG